MAKAARQVDENFLENARAQAAKLLQEAFVEARRGHEDKSGETKPVLFPNGIDLIHVKFEVEGLKGLAKFAIDVEVAGAKPKTP